MHSHESSCHPALTPSLHQWPLSMIAGVLPQGHVLQPLGQLPPHVSWRDRGGGRAVGEGAPGGREGQTNAVYLQVWSFIAEKRY